MTAPVNVPTGPYYWTENTAGQYHDRVTGGHPLVVANPVRCRGCGEVLPAPFLDHGDQPVANGFRAAGAEQAPSFPISYAFCPNCKLVSLVAPPPPEALFPNTYPFLTGSSQEMSHHYAAKAGLLRGRYQPESMLEIGCNDGTFLQHFTDLRHVGYEPAEGVAKMARKQGCFVIQAPFTLEAACLLASAQATTGGEERLRNFDLICAHHVLTHIADLNDVLDGIDVLLAPDGVLVLEDPSLDAIVSAGAFDQCYDEHAQVFSLPALVNLLLRHDLLVTNVEAIPVHGGSLRVTATRSASHRLSASSRLEGQEHVRQRLQAERYLTHAVTYQQFASEARLKVGGLALLLNQLHDDGKRVAGYGASSKLTLVLNLLGGVDGLVSFVTDTTPAKIGTVVPGTRIPVIGRGEVPGKQPYPDVFLLGAYVHLDEVLKKEQTFLEAGGKFLVWNPTVRLIGKDDL